jgi:hypothetical protein
MRDEGYYFITLLHFKIWSSNFEVQMLHVTHWTQHAAQSLGRLGWSVQPRLLVQIILSCAYCVQMGVKNLLTLWHDSCLRTKKGLQGGKTIQQRSEFFASRGPFSFYQFSGSCPCALCTHVCVSTQLCVAATLLLLPGAGTHDSDGPLSLNVVTY